MDNIRPNWNQIHMKQAELIATRPAQPSPLPKIKDLSLSMREPPGKGISPNNLFCTSDKLSPSALVNGADAQATSPIVKKKLTKNLFINFHPQNTER